MRTVLQRGLNFCALSLALTFFFERRAKVDSFGQKKTRNDRGRV
jgi:hypothetical protein